MFKQFRPQLISSLKGYDKKTFVSDLMAGVIVGIVALPLAIAFAIASGVSPEKGIITAVVAGFLVSLFGGSKVQIGGPTGAFIIIVYGIIAEYGMEGLTIATFMAGIFLILLAVLKLGSIIKFIPYPIVVGFTSGIAVTILTTQIKDFFGLTIAEVPGDFIGKWGCYLSNIGTIDLWSTLVGVLSVVIIIFTPRFSKKIPGSLVAIVVMTLITVLLKKLGVDSIETIGDRFSISAQLPEAVMPELTWSRIVELVSPAATIAILGAIESLLSATVADGVISAHHNSNTELLGQGIANIGSALLGGIPATGAIARTMTNINNGGRTPVAGLIHAVVLLLIFLFLMPLAKFIPMASLAGVLVVVSYNMSGWRSFISIFNNPKSDILVLMTTFLLTIIFDLTVAIEVGLLLACFLFMKRVAETSEVKVTSDEIDVASDNDLISATDEHITVPKGVEVYEINGPYFFGAGNKFEDMMSNFRTHPKVRIIRMRKVTFVDSTGIHNLTNLCSMCHKKGVLIVLSGVNERVRAALGKAGFFDLIKEQNVCSHIDLALVRAKEVVEEIEAAEAAAAALAASMPKEDEDRA